MRRLLCSVCVTPGPPADTHSHTHTHTHTHTHMESAVVQTTDLLIDGSRPIYERRETDPGVADTIAMITCPLSSAPEGGCNMSYELVASPGCRQHVWPRRGSGFWNGSVLQPSSIPIFCSDAPIAWNRLPSNYLICPPPCPRWWRSTVVERRSLTGELSVSCARPAADG